MDTAPGKVHVLREMISLSHPKCHFDSNISSCFQTHVVGFCASPCGPHSGDFIYLPPRSKSSLVSREHIQKIIQCNKLKIF